MLALISLLFVTLCGVAGGQSSALDAEATEEDLNDLMGWTRQIDRRNNTRFSWDYSLRSVHAAGTPRTGMLGAVGADLYHVFSSTAGSSSVGARPMLEWPPPQPQHLMQPRVHSSSLYMARQRA